MSEWQPIETAPQDGALVRIRFDRPWVFPKQDWDTLAKFIGWQVGNPWGWVNKVGQSFQWPPTHWMPAR